jgi:hypothetical protein
LKLENVFVEQTNDGKQIIRIVDVGSPVVFGAHHLSGERQVVGSPKYFSPEQASGESVGLPSDQFTLGVIGYLLLTGALPFFGATPNALLDAVSAASPKPILEREPNVPEVIAHVVDRCLNREPENRHDGLRGLATELAAAIKALREMPVKQAQIVDEDTTKAVDISMFQDRPSADDNADRTVVFAVPDDLSALVADDLLDDESISSTSDDLLGTDSVSGHSVDLDVHIDSIPEPLTTTSDIETEDITAAIQASIVQLEDGGTSDSGPKAGPDSAPPTEPEEDDLAAAMAAAINVFTDEEEQENTALLQAGADAAAVPLTEPPPAVPSVEEADGNTALFLPEDLLSGLGDAFEEQVGRQPVQPLGQPEAPVASVADFDEVETMSERDKQKRLERKTAALPRIGGLSRPWMVAFLLLLLVVTALYARVMILDNAAEETQIREARERVQAVQRAALKKAQPRLIKFTSKPVGATAFLGNVAQGVTPYVQTVKGKEVLKLRLTLKGYENYIYQVKPMDFPKNGVPLQVEIALTKKQQVPEKAAALDDKPVAEQVPAVVKGLQKSASPGAVNAPNTRMPTQKVPRSDRAKPVSPPRAPKIKRVPPRPKNVRKGKPTIQVKPPKRRPRKRRRKPVANDMENPY